MKDLVILILVAVIFVLVAYKMTSSFAPGGSAPSSDAFTVGDTKTMLKSGMSEADVVLALSRSGLTTSQAQQMVAQAKAS